MKGGRRGRRGAREFRPDPAGWPGAAHRPGRGMGHRHLAHPGISGHPRLGSPARRIPRRGPPCLAGMGGDGSGRDQRSCVNRRPGLPSRVPMAVEHPKNTPHRPQGLPCRTSHRRARRFLPAAFASVPSGSTAGGDSWQICPTVLHRRSPSFPHFMPGGRQREATEYSRTSDDREE